MTKLTNGIQVRLVGWQHDSVPVRTVRGYAAEYGEDQEAAHQRAIEHAHNTAWTTFTGYTLYGDRAEGRRAQVERIAKHAAAIILEAGQQVEIEGEIFTVKVSPRNEKSPYNSDPIHFIRA